MQNFPRNASKLGANGLPDGRWEFLVWAPNARKVSVNFKSGKREPLMLEPLERGYFGGIAANLELDAQYLYRLDGDRELPDPASRFQPQGVHGPSQIVDTSSCRWTDQSWTGRPLGGSIVYELHVGTFTPEGTFDALIPHLPELLDLGVTTIELMPIAQFPGARNWGYDGTFEFAPQNSYGGPQSLQRFIDAAHHHGLAVALDVVYNHLGPEGNYLSAFGAYFTDRYRTPWGEALNFDGPGSDEVRRFFIENALYWLEDYHFDALRLDAIHGIFDSSAQHFLAELKAEVANLSKQSGRDIYLIAESDLNDARILNAPERGGYNLDAQWSDDFHHALHSLLTKEKRGYYADFGGIDPLITTLKDGWYFSGQYSEHRQRRHGSSPQGLSPSRFIVCDQNHDQVGNRAAGDRLNSQVSFEAMKLAAGITLLAPFTPMLFMGEEYGETAPFQYFTSHGDPALVEAVRKGRREEFAAFGWEESVPDPQDEQTYLRSKLNHSLRGDEPHRTLWQFYRRLIQIRKEYKLASPASQTVRPAGDEAILLLRENGDQKLALIFNFAERQAYVSLSQLSGSWVKVIDSADISWKGPRNDSESNVTIAAPRELQLYPHSFLMLAQGQTDGKSA
jgi:maltooligosyltrehalose trehalohydrolase